MITVNGCRIYLHIHDAEYMRQRAEWKRRLAAVHPDHGGSAAAFRSLMAQRLVWQRAEALYYARLGLLPPDGWDAATYIPIRERAIEAAKPRTDAHLTTSDRRLAMPARHSNRKPRKDK